MTVWPTRSQWAQARQTASHRAPQIPTTLSDYATPAEIAALQQALRQRLAEIGHKTEHPWPHRRAGIRRVIELVDQGELPLSPQITEGAIDILHPIHARFFAAREALHAKNLSTQTAVDDSAWAQELERRAKSVGRVNTTRRAK